MSELVSGDTGSFLQVTCIDAESQTPINLLTNQPFLCWKTAGVAHRQAMDVVDAVNGVCEYRFGAGELVAPRMKFEVEVVDGSNFKVTSRVPVEVTVRERIA